MVRLLERVADAAWFHNAITIVILLAGVLVGVETYPSAVDRHGPVLHTLDAVILGVFVLEIVIKVGAQGRRPWRYFLDPWNVFDFTIVAAAFLPVDAQYVTVLRLARLLRVLKLVRALPKLQMLVAALLKSIPSMAYVSLLLVLLFYVYGVSSVFLFGGNDPKHFGDLQVAMVSLFRTVTLEDWTDLMYIQMYGCDRYGYDGEAAALCTNPSAQPGVAIFFFVSFVLLGTMIVLNLFVGVIMNGMTEAQREHMEREREQYIQSLRVVPLHEDIAQLNKQLEHLQDHVRRLARRASEEQALRDAEREGRAPRAPAVPSERKVKGATPAE